MTAGVPTAYTNGRPPIGVLFYKGHDLKAHYCTASVVNSATRNLILSAAHCRPGSLEAFVPGYRIHGTTTAPYGIWPVLKNYTDSRYRSTGAGTDFDYAFAKVAANTAGKQIQDVVRGNTLTATPTYTNHWVGVTGYPRANAAPVDRPVTAGRRPPSWPATTRCASSATPSTPGPRAAPG